MTTRNEYLLHLFEVEFTVTKSHPAGLHLRLGRQSDVRALAELMVDAYRGTIDYDDETIEDAISEVQAYMGGHRGGAPLLDASHLAFEEEILVSACLVAEWDERQRPLIAYLMTRADWKNKGLGRLVLLAALNELKSGGNGEVGAVITEGNSDSEHLFRSLGFQKVSGI